jgi:hypothetical protein
VEVLVMTPLLALLLILAQAQAKKLPVPDAAAEKKAERDVRDVFKAEYARKSPAERAALAALLMAQALQTKDDPAARYVLLREARDVAAGEGDVRSALVAVDELDRSFQVDAPALRYAAVAAAAKGVRTPEDGRAVADAALGFAGEALVAEDFAAAERYAAEAVAAAKKSKLVALAAKAEARVKEIVDRRGAAEALKKATQTLAERPDDPEANLVAGRHECFRRGRWGAGLPMLAKSSDPALRDLALKDLAPPAEVEARVGLGDQWWEVADKNPVPMRDVIRQRAAFWYQQVDGPAKARVERRVEESRAAAAVDLLALIDAKKDSVRGGWELDKGALACVRPEAAARVQIPYVPPDEYDVTIVAERTAGVEAINVGLVKDDIKFHMVVDGWATQGYFSALSLIDKKYGNENETRRPGGLLTNGRPSTIVCTVRTGLLKMTVDGKQIFEWTGDVRRLSNYFVLNTPHPRALYLSAWDSKYRFSKIVLTPVSGGLGERLR